jgi:hypothetical protein
MGDPMKPVRDIEFGSMFHQVPDHGIPLFQHGCEQTAGTLAYVNGMELWRIVNGLFDPFDNVVVFASMTVDAV